MEVIDTGCPIVLKPSKERIAASLKKMGKQLPVHEGLVQGGVYPWLSKESLEAKGQVRKEQIVQEIRRKNDRDLKKLLQQHRIDYETTTVRLEKFKNSLNWNSEEKTVAQSELSSKHETKQRRPLLLPLGYNHLARPFGGKQLKRVHKTLENERRSFDPVDSSLLLQDHTGFNLTKKLHSRVHSIEKEQRNYLLSPQPSKRDDFKPKRVLHESIKRCMLKPMFIESVLTSTKKVLASQPQLKDAKINWSNLNIDHIIESMNKKTKPKNSKNDHCVELYEISKLPAEIRDKHCQKDRPTEVHFFVNSKKTTNSSTLMKASPSLSPDKNNQNRLNGKKDQPFDVTRLPYLYLCPSI